MTLAESAVTIDVITVCAGVLGAIALTLLWRCYRLQAELGRLRAARDSEHGMRTQAEHALLDIRCRLAQTLADHEDVKAAERQRIGRDLHDDLGQHLLALTMEVSTLASLHPRLRQPLARIDSHLRTALRSLRTVVKDLLPEALQQGLRAAVESQLTQFTRLSGIHCRLDADPAAFHAVPDGRIQATLYRILQESLSNIARHAQATQVDVALCRQAGALSLTVRDNGVGLPPQRATAGHRCGLDGIAQRIEAIGGRFHASSQPGQGTTLSMWFPLDIALRQTPEMPATAQ
jgi:signal transduction histidine kinase